MMRRHKSECRCELKLRTRRKHVRKPPRGSAARLLECAGLWSHMGREEIERIKHEIFSSRRSSDYVPDFSGCITTNEEPE